MGVARVAQSVSTDESVLSGVGYIFSAPDLVVLVVVKLKDVIVIVAVAIAIVCFVWLLAR